MQFYHTDPIFKASTLLFSIALAKRPLSLVISTYKSFTNHGHWVIGESGYLEIADYVSYPELIVSTAGKHEYNVNFFNRTPTVAEMFKLADGASGMKYIMLGYERRIQKFKCDGKHFPVIMIVDNDTAGRELSVASKKYSSTTIKHHVIENLYIIELPKVAGKDIEMEDYFDSTVLSIKNNGKIFNRSNGKIDTSKEYGKDYFSNYVIKKKQSSINFDAFKPLLDENTDVVKSHV